MIRNYFKKTIFFSMMFFAFCCEMKKQKAIPKNLDDIKSSSLKVNKFFEKRFNDYVDRKPMFQTRLGIKKDYDKWNDISPIAEEKEIDEAKRSLDWLTDSVNINYLDQFTLLSYKLYKQRIENQISDYRYRLYNYPLNQMYGMQSDIPAFLINMHKISTKKDAIDYISRLNGIRGLFQQLEANMKERQKAGLIAPRFVFNHVLDDSKNIITGHPFNGPDSSALFIDIYSKINLLNISETEKKELVNEARKALLSSVKPAYDSLILLVEELLSSSEEKDGVWRWPEGLAFYENALERTTTTTLSADEIHEYGLKEVSRIHSEMTIIKNKVGFKGPLEDFFIELKENDKFYYPQTDEGKNAYIRDAINIIENITQKLDELFITKPKAEMVVKAVEGFREKSAGKAFYQRPAPDGSRPGTYYANMYKMRMMPKYQMEALAYHEGIPGHHMQIAIAQELEGIPKFRKYGGYTSFTEGWGLYSEYLPKELGYYSDPYSDFGRLAMELWRSCRLVVDTGIHSKQWTREQGIDYYTKNTPNDILDCIKMVERHIVMPSQATAYKIGMDRILELRDKARKQLKEKFDIRKFHETILANGAVPLYILEQQIDNMIKENISE
tara:strand:+ start:4107 stop:5942 length:1836 start_codon:yes stop_codon:yes gene_type:complete